MGNGSKQVRAPRARYKIGLPNIIPLFSSHLSQTDRLRLNWLVDKPIKPPVTYNAGPYPTKAAGSNKLLNRVKTKSKRNQPGFLWRYWTRSELWMDATVLSELTRYCYSIIALNNYYYY